MNIIAVSWALLAGVAAGGLHAQQGARDHVAAAKAVFDVVSIRPGDPSAASSLTNASAISDLNISSVTVKELILRTYDLRPFQLTGEPGWADTVRYDIQAKTLQDAQARNINRNLRIQSLLADYFGMTSHTVLKETAVYSLVVSKPGRLKPNPGSTPFRIQRGVIRGKGVPIRVIVDQLSWELDHILFDRTGLTGFYDVDLTWNPDDGAGNESVAPALRTALEEQLGLKIVSEKAPVPILVVDHLERPTMN